MKRVVRPRRQVIVIRCRGGHGYGVDVLRARGPAGSLRAGLAAVLLLAGAAAPARAQVAVSVSPAEVVLEVGEDAVVEIRLRTEAEPVVAGGVFLAFDAERLDFTGGSVDAGFWNWALVTTQPRVNQSGVVSFSVGRSGGVAGDDVLVARLGFRARAPGATELGFLFNAGAERTVFTREDLVTEFATSGVGAAVTIVAPTPTPTPPAAATATATPTVAIAACTGDCGADLTVTVDEILVMVGVALGSLGAGECVRGDASGDGEITVDEILAAVQHALAGCPAP